MKKPRHKNTKIYKLSNGRKVTAYDIATATGLGIAGCRSRLNKYNDASLIMAKKGELPRQQLKERHYNKSAPISKIISKRPAYDSMFKLAMKKI